MDGPKQGEAPEIQIEMTLSVRRRRPNPEEPRPPARPARPGQIPRISRLMALAIKFQEMVDGGEVTDYADLARLGYVTRARLTQIMNLTLLAPDIQERLIDANLSEKVSERHLRVACLEAEWSCQRQIVRVSKAPR